MESRAQFRVALTLLLVLVTGFFANVVYCILSFAQVIAQQEVTSLDLVESVALLALGIGLLVAFFSYSAVGWWVIVSMVTALCIYDVVTVLAFEVGEWVYLYLFFVTTFYGALIYTMLNKLCVEKFSVHPVRMVAAPKFFFSAAIAFLFIFIVGSELLGVFVGGLILVFLFGKVRTPASSH